MFKKAIAITLLAICVFALPSGAFAAISFISNTAFNPGSPPYAANSVAASAGDVMVHVQQGDGSDNMNAPTWNGQTFTLVAKNSLSGSWARYRYMWKLVVVTGGTANVAFTGPSDVSLGWVNVYRGAADCKNYQLVDTTGTSASISASPAAASDSWLVGGGNNQSGNISGGTNTTNRSALSSAGLGDSNGVASPTALAWTWGGASTAYLADVCELTASGGGGGATFAFWQFLNF